MTMAKKKRWIDFITHEACFNSTCRHEGPDVKHKGNSQPRSSWLHLQDAINLKQDHVPVWVNWYSSKMVKSARSSGWYIGHMPAEKTTSEMSHSRHSSLNSSSFRVRCWRHGRSSNGISGEGIAEMKASLGSGTPLARHNCKNSNEIHVPTLWAISCHT